MKTSLVLLVLGMVLSTQAIASQAHLLNWTKVWLFIDDPKSTTLLARNAVWDSDNWNEGLSGYNSSMVWWLVNRNKAVYERCEAITLYYGATTPAQDATWDTDNWGAEGRQL